MKFCSRPDSFKLLSVVRIWGKLGYFPCKHTLPRLASSQAKRIQRLSPSSKKTANRMTIVMAHSPRPVRLGLHCKARCDLTISHWYNAAYYSTGSQPPDWQWKWKQSPLDCLKRWQSDYGIACFIVTSHSRLWRDWSDTDCWKWHLKTV